MPPKRQSTDASGNTAKKAKTGANANPGIPRSKRWSKVSGSANVDDGYRLHASKPDAYEYECLCKPFHGNGLDSDDEYDGDEEEGNADKVSQQALNCSNSVAEI
jgi:hypothetical protein